MVDRIYCLEEVVNVQNTRKTFNQKYLSTVSYTACLIQYLILMKMTFSKIETFNAVCKVYFALCPLSK